MIRSVLVLALSLSIAMPALAQDAAPSTSPDTLTALGWHGRPTQAQQQAVMRQFLAVHQHSDDLLWPMLVAGASQHLCPQTTGAIGFRFLDFPRGPEANSTGKALGVASSVAGLATRGGLVFGGLGLASNGFASLFHHDKDPGKQLGIVFGGSVDHLPTDTPAAHAGVHEGDVITAIDGQALTPGRTDSASLSNELLLHAAAADRAGGKPVHLDLVREGQLHAIVVVPATVCDVSIRDTAMAGPFDSSSADPQHIVVDARLMSEAATDQERQIVLAHLLGHTLLLQLHDAASQAQATGQAASIVGERSSAYLATAPVITAIPAGELIAIVTNATNGSSGQEIAADRIGLVLAQSVGINPSDVEAFWSVERADHWHGWFESHRMTPQRLAALHAVVQQQTAASQVIAPTTTSATVGSVAQ
jgi:hypothetical protein